MANRNSQFLKISDKFLLEYIYGSENDSRDHGINEFIILSIDGNLQVLNPNIYNIEQNQIQYTNNTPIKSVVRSNVQQANTHVWLDVNPLNPSVTNWVVNEGPSHNIFYLPNATPSSPLSISYQTQGENIIEGVVYDTVRLHLISGFDFTNYNGTLFKVNVTDSLGKLITLAHHLFDPNLHQVEFNPSPIIFGETLYETFIEFKVPSPARLQDEWERVESTYTSEVDKKANSLLHNLSAGHLNKNLYIRFQLTDIQTKSAVRAVMKNNPNYISNNSDYRFYYTINAITATLPTIPQLSRVSVHIEEATDGDYFNLSGRFGGANIQQFINALNRQSLGNNILIYDVSVIETLPDLSSVTTQTLTLTQVENFNQPVPFRPVIMNENAISFTITVNMRVYDTTNSSSISKFASMTLVEATTGGVHKYGKFQHKIDLTGDWTNFQFKQHKIYNLNPSSPIISLPNTLNDILVGSNIKYVYRYLDKLNIVLKQGNVTVDEEGKIANEESIDITELYGIGSNLVVKLEDTNNYLKFVVYDKTGNYFLRKNLSSQGTFKIRFGNNDKALTYAEIKDPAINSVEGEMLFKIPNKDTSILRELTRTSNKFCILLDSNGEESTIYTGFFRFYDQDRLLAEETLQDVISQNKNILQKYESAQEYISQLQEKIKDLTSHKLRLLGKLRSTKIKLENTEERLRMLQNIQNNRQDYLGLVGPGIVVNNDVYGFNYYSY